MRNVAFVSVLSLTALLVATPAGAEGGFASSISDARTGFNSRTWTDRNSDNVSTTVRFDRCEVTGDGVEPDRAEVQLTRIIPVLPDQNRGRKTLNCDFSATGSWGDQPASDYRFAIITINGSSSGRTLDVARVEVTY